MKRLYSSGRAIPVAISERNRVLTAAFYGIPESRVEMVVNPVELSLLAQVSGGYDLLPKEKVLLDFWQDGVEEAGIAEGQQGVSAKPICSSRCGFCHVLQLTRLPITAFSVRPAVEGRRRLSVM